MDKDEILTSAIWYTFIFITFLLLNHYFFNFEMNVWELAFIPMGKDILALLWKYGVILWKQKTKEFVVLKESTYKARDFAWILVTFGVVGYLRIDVIHYLIPVAIVNLLLLYLVKKHQYYYFGEWDLENLSEWGEHIDIFCIISIDFQLNQLKIVYVENEDNLKKREHHKKFLIKREQLKSPKSWSEFEQIVNHFENSLAIMNKSYQKKNTTLDSSYESIS